MTATLLDGHRHSAHQFASKRWHRFGASSARRTTSPSTPIPSGLRRYSRRRRVPSVAPTGAKQSRNSRPRAARRASNSVDDVRMSRVELLDAADGTAVGSAVLRRRRPRARSLPRWPPCQNCWRRALGFVGSALGAGAIGARAKEFAILRTSALQGCSYCIHAHTTVVARRRSRRTSRCGRCAARCRSRTASPIRRGARPDPMDRRNGRRHRTGARRCVGRRPRALGRARLVEISVTVGATMFLNRFATGFELPTTAPHVLEIGLDAEGMA